MAEPMTARERALACVMEHRATQGPELTQLAADHLVYKITELIEADRRDQLASLTAGQDVEQIADRLYVASRQPGGYVPFYALTVREKEDWCKVAAEACTLLAAARIEARDAIADIAAHHFGGGGGKQFVEWIRSLDPAKLTKQEAKEGEEND